jgi:hypothetical protein
MKSVGLVTRVMTDQDTHRKLAIVYVPTTPNPTSGYLEVVPLERVVPTDWTLDEAMNFVISAGAVAPDRIRYSNLSEHQDDTDAKAETAPSAPLYAAQEFDDHQQHKHAAKAADQYPSGASACVGVEFGPFGGHVVAALVFRFYGHFMPFGDELPRGNEPPTQCSG